MAANTAPIFALTPSFNQATITAVTTDKTGGSPANLVTLVTGAAYGTKITEIGYHFQGNSSAGLFLIFVTNSAGTTPQLYQELSIATTINSTTVSAASNYSLYSDFQIASGQQVLVGMTTISGTTACSSYAKTGSY